MCIVPHNTFYLTSVTATTQETRDKINMQSIGSTVLERTAIQCCTYSEKKGLEEDIVNLRYKHHLSRLIDILNRVLEERRKISNLNYIISFLEQELQRDELR